MENSDGSSEGGTPLRQAFTALELQVLKGDIGDPEKTREALEGMTRDVAMLGLFGRSERVEELPTSSLDLLLLPALLAAHTQAAARHLPTRAEELTKAKVYYKDFVRRLRDYGFAEDLLGREEAEEEEEGEPGPSSAQPAAPARPDIPALERQRQAKIARFREKAQLEGKMAAVAKALAEGRRLDEEAQRDHRLEKLRYWALKALEELGLIEQELPMLRQMAARGGPSTEAPKAQGPAKPWRPLIIAKDAAQKAVFGRGYPSYYTMSVREYMDMTHHLHDHAPAARPAEDERDDDQLGDGDLDRLRALDDYKDFHRRGWGNTHNKG